MKKENLDDLVTIVLLSTTIALCIGMVIVILFK